jgi:RES domain-containing protein
MVVFRIERKKYLETTLQGLGASMAAGFRWNSLHHRMVYTAGCRALATLEVAVHLDISEDLPTDRVFVEIHIPDDVVIQQLSADDLPDDWHASPPMPLTQWIGDQFLQRKSSAVLQVPSSIIPKEFNYLINPLHADAARITVVETYAMDFDSLPSKNSQPL